MSDMKYEVLWTALKEMLEDNSKNDTVDGVLSKAFLTTMNICEERYAKIQEEPK